MLRRTDRLNYCHFTPGIPQNSLPGTPEMGKKNHTMVLETPETKFTMEYWYIIILKLLF